MEYARLSEQFITLSGGVYTVPWANQLERLNFMASFASKLCNLPLSSVPFDGDLRIYRRIVIEVRSSFFGERHVTVGLPFVQNELYGGSIGVRSGDGVQGELGPDTSTVFASGTGRPFSLQPPLQWQERLGIFERGREGRDVLLHELLLEKNGFVEVLVNMEFKVVSFGTTEASLKVSLRLDHVVRLGRQGELRCG